MAHVGQKEALGLGRSLRRRPGLLQQGLHRGAGRGCRRLGRSPGALSCRVPGAPLLDLPVRRQQRPPRPANTALPAAQLTTALQAPGAPPSARPNPTPPHLQLALRGGAARELCDVALHADQAGQPPRRVADGRDAQQVGERLAALAVVQQLQAQLPALRAGAAGRRSVPVIQIISARRACMGSQARWDGDTEGNWVLSRACWRGWSKAPSAAGSTCVVAALGCAGRPPRQPLGAAGRECSAAQRTSRTALRRRSTAAGSVAGPCRTRQLRPTTSSLL